MELKVKKLTPEAKLPVRMSAAAAGYDVHAVNEVTIAAGKVELVSTGIAVEIPEGHFGMLAPRSSLALKKGVEMPHSFGVIDSDYRGELLVALKNTSAEDFVVERDERIAQLIILPYADCKITEVGELTDSDRGTGGFGSTGKK